MINKYLLREKVNELKKLIKEKDGKPFSSFSRSKYFMKEEDYKVLLAEEGRKNLNAQKWNKKLIGTGEISGKIWENILQSKNLISSFRFFTLYFKNLEEKWKTFDIKKIEEVFYNLYTDQISDEDSFGELVKIFGKRYSLIAYLFFIKDRKKYLPIATTTFEKVFSEIGNPLALSSNCSWENYSEYLSNFYEIQGFLSEELCEQIELIDAHSVLWIIARNSGKKKNNIKIPGKEKTVFFDVKPAAIDYNFEIKKTNQNQITHYSQNENERIEQDNNNKYIGNLGEDFVFTYEREKLKMAGRKDLADEVKRINNNALGFDISSFESNGSPIEIEVKTTTLNNSTFTFYISQNEIARAKNSLNQGYLYCVRNIKGEQPSIRIIGKEMSVLEKALGWKHEQNGFNITPKKFKVIIRFLE